MAGCTWARAGGGAAQGGPLACRAGGRGGGLRGPHTSPLKRWSYTIGLAELVASHEPSLRSVDTLTRDPSVSVTLSCRIKPRQVSVAPPAPLQNAPW